MDSSRYIANAERCLAIARMVGSRDIRITLRQMASEWARVATALDRESPERA
jgi:hypothetical protein